MGTRAQRAGGEAYEPPAVGDACGLGVRVDLEQSVFVCAAAPCSDLRMSSSTINRAAALTCVAVGHEGVVVVGAVRAVGVAFAVAGIVVKDARAGVPKLRDPRAGVGARPLLAVMLQQEVPPPHPRPRHQPGVSIAALFLLRRG